MYFLHEMGYTFFDLGKLTYGEINLLINCFNKEQRKQKLQMKKGRGKKKW